MGYLVSPCGGASRPSGLFPGFCTPGTDGFETIGRSFGGRNHTTVMHACRRTAERLASDPEAYETVRRLTERLAEPGSRPT